MSNREELRDILIKYTDDLREYIHESGCNLYHDERDSSQFVDIFLMKHDSKQASRDVLLSLRKEIDGKPLWKLILGREKLND